MYLIEIYLVILYCTDTYIMKHAEVAILKNELGV